jgi:hypothetical protein
MGGIYEVRRWDGLRCHHIRTKFHKDRISLVLFFQNKGSRLKNVKELKAGIEL